MTTTTGTIIVFNGPSSSGKTTLCAQVRKRLPDAYLCVSVDQFIGMLPPRYLSGFWRPSPLMRASFRVAKAARLLPARYENLLDTPPEDRKQVWASMIIGFYHSLVTLAEKGNNLLVDTVITDRPTYDLCADLMATQKAYFVGLYCSPAVLRRRERRRISRQRGLAVSQARVVHFDEIYDLRLETDKLSLRECCQAVCNMIAANNEPAAFRQIARGDRAK
jgi:chloramphenicol 3-O phosphotransferase